MSDLCEKCGYDWLEGDAMSRKIDELKALCVRAADALDRPETRAYMQQWVESLIAELRKETK